MTHSRTTTASAASVVALLLAFACNSPAVAQTVTSMPALATSATNSVATAPTSGPSSVSRDNAREMALDYLDYSAFSRTGLIKQLKYEGFSTADATYGADATHANWYRQAARMAADYLDYSSFSRRGLIAQLKYEGFTTSQATYGVNRVGL